VVDVVGSLGLTWQPAFGIILVLYFYSHYFFASGEQLATLCYIVSLTCSGKQGLYQCKAYTVLASHTKYRLSQSKN
jgi:hypothetical protein